MPVGSRTDKVHAIGAILLVEERAPLSDVLMVYVYRGAYPQTKIYSPLRTHHDEQQQERQTRAHQQPGRQAEDHDRTSQGGIGPFVH